MILSGNYWLKSFCCMQEKEKHLWVWWDGSQGKFTWRLSLNLTPRECYQCPWIVDKEQGAPHPDGRKFAIGQAHWARTLMDQTNVSSQASPHLTSELAMAMVWIRAAQELLQILSKTKRTMKKTIFHYICTSDDSQEKRGKRAISQYTTRNHKVGSHVPSGMNPLRSCLKLYVHP